MKEKICTILLFLSLSVVFQETSFSQSEIGTSNSDESLERAIQELSDAGRIKYLDDSKKELTVNVTNINLCRSFCDGECFCGYCEVFMSTEKQGDLVYSGGGTITLEQCFPVKDPQKTVILQPIDVFN